MNMYIRNTNVYILNVILFTSNLHMLVLLQSMPENKYMLLISDRVIVKRLKLRVRLVSLG